MKLFRTTLLFIAATLCIAGLTSCASSRFASMVPEGEHYLAKNKIVIENSKEVKPSDLNKYLAQMPTKSTGIGFSVLKAEPVIFDSTQVDASINAIIQRLQYLGFYDSKAEASSSYEGKRASVTYNVTVGKQYPMKEIKYNVADSVMADIYAANRAKTLVKEGDRLAESVLELESQRMASVFRDNGYYGFSKNYFFFFADTTATRDSALLAVELRDYTRNESPSAARPHTRYEIGNVSVVPQGRLKVKSSFLQYLNRIEPSTPYSESVINNTYSRFTSNRLFSTVNVEMTPRDSSIVDCAILLSPSKIQSIGFDLQGSVNSTGLFGVNPSVTYSHKNLFGGGEYFTMNVGGNWQFMFNTPAYTNEFSLSTSLSIPRFVFAPSKWFNGPVLPRTNILLSYNHQKRPEYDRSIIASSYGYSFSPTPNISIEWTPVRANVVNVYDMDSTFFKSLSSSYLQYSYMTHVDIGGGINAYYTTNTATNPKESYFYVRFSGNVAGNLLNMLDPLMKQNSAGQSLILNVPYAQYARGEVNLVRTTFFSPDLSLATRLAGGLGYAYGNSNALPLEQRFYGGGANSLRGWHSRTVGPGMSPLDTAFTIANQTGDLRLEANIELRFPIYNIVKGAVFVDAGNIWELPHYSDDKQTIENEDAILTWKNLLKSTAVSWGAGVRLDLQMLVIRIDLGIKGYDPAAQSWRGPDRWFRPDGYTLHFGVGYPF
jgi:outer membrane protein assembly factor BamA